MVHDSYLEGPTMVGLFSMFHFSHLLRMLWKLHQMVLLHSMVTPSGNLSLIFQMSLAVLSS